MKTNKEDFNSRINDRIKKAESSPIFDLELKFLINPPENMKDVFDKLLSGWIISKKEYEEGRKYFGF